MALSNVALSFLVLSIVAMNIPGDVPGLQYGAMGLLGLSMLIFSVFLSKAWRDLIALIEKTTENDYKFIQSIGDLKSSIDRLNEEVRGWRKNS